MPGDLPRISLVIPAYNEAAFLSRLLDSIAVARASYQRSSDSVEVVLADNGSTDATVQVARDWGCLVVEVEKRIIGAVRNGGARFSKGDILAFIDADTQVHPETFNEIERVMASPRVIAGVSGARFERMSVGIACTQALLVLVGMLIGGVRSLAGFHLETGVVFCRREAFEEVGGYREDLLYTEDVRFLIDLRTLGRTRGMHVVRGTRAKAVFSTRKFDQHGDWHYFTMPLRLAWGALRGQDDLAREYWYRGRS